MYKLLLTFRYLRRKLIPIFALLAVMLCTAMVIIVISVMGGFLDLVKNAGRTLMGDVSIYAGLGGFGRYEQLIEKIEALPEADSAAPIIVAYGLIKLPGDTIKGVQVYGVNGREQDRVTAFRQTLYWTKQRLEDYPDVQPIFRDHDPVTAAVEMKPPWPAAAEFPAMLVGIEVNPFNNRNADGTYSFPVPLPGMPITLTILPISPEGGVDALTPETQQFAVVNEFNSGVYDVDSQRVMIPFESAQRMMRMTSAARVLFNEDGTPQVNPDGTIKTEGEVPARCTEIHVRAKAGVSAETLRDAVQRVYNDFSAQHQDVPPPAYARVETWQERQAGFLRAVENEKGLMTVLFGIISIVAVVMIGVIFYMIVLEKTRDIGILRAIGASQSGVASIFLMYGAAIGAIGAALGTTLAYLIVTYINEIHDWLGRTFGIVIWDRSVYFFDRIPNQVNTVEVIVIVIVAIAASLIGALAPAIKAAMVDPVRSLRYE